MQQILATVSRCLVLLLVILGLAGTLWMTDSRRLSVLFLGDTSDSVPDSAPIQLSNHWNELSLRLPKDGQLGAITFAVTNHPVSPLAHSPKPPAAWARPAQASETAIEGAVRLAEESLPADT